MFFFNKKKNDKISVFSPCNGEFIKQESINDSVFSSGMVGIGFAIKPSENTIYAPMDGEIAMVFPTKHALGFKCKDNVECIVHIGVDTVKLNGEGFSVLVNEGDVVKAGQPLVKVDFDKVRSSGYHDDVIVVLQNTKAFDLNSTFKTVKANELIATCE